jgi:hypothetical protein
MNKCAAKNTQQKLTQFLRKERAVVSGCDNFLQRRFDDGFFGQIINFGRT